MDINDHIRERKLLEERAQYLIDKGYVSDKTVQELVDKMQEEMNKKVGRTSKL